MNYFLRNTQYDFHISDLAEFADMPTLDDMRNRQLTRAIEDYYRAAADLDVSASQAKVFFDAAIRAPGALFLNTDQILGEAYRRLRHFEPQVATLLDLDTWTRNVIAMCFADLAGDADIFELVRDLFDCFFKAMDKEGYGVIRTRRILAEELMLCRSPADIHTAFFTTHTRLDEPEPVQG